VEDEMTDRNKNDTLQSSEDDPALGQDARSFGEGGQVEQRAFEPRHRDAKDRDPDRDPTVPDFQSAGEDR
jgi:hypothetical protein